jgi:hypothetical protein
VFTLTSVAGGDAAELEPRVVYRRTPSSPGTGIEIRLRVPNSGNSSAVVNTRVLTFAPFEVPAYGYGYGATFLAAIGGELL